MIHKIGVLTSGGDAPGMNCAIRAVVRAGLRQGLEVFGVEDGYKGLVEDRIFQMDRGTVSDIVNRGGTILRTARLREFKEEAVRQIAVDNLRKRGIEALKVVYSTEEPVMPAGGGRTPGSVAFVPSAAGLVIAGEVVKDLIRGDGKKREAEE